MTASLDQPCAAWGTPCPSAQPCPCRPDPRPLPEPVLCGRLLIGLGGDTWDPECSLPRGHEGGCKP